MTWPGSRCLLAWILTRDALLSVLPACEWQKSLLKASINDIPAVSRKTLFLANAAVLKGSNLSSVSTAHLQREPTTAVAENPHGTDAVAFSVARGRRLQLEGSLHEAAAVLEGVLSSNQNEPAALLHLAEVYQELGEPRRAAAAADQLLAMDQLTVEARSFVLNLRGIYVKSVGDLVGARESYELALSQGGKVNRHALYNLALLLHYPTTPTYNTPPPDISALEQAIGFYRAALGRGSASSSTLPSLLTTGAPEELGRRDDGIGGPVDRASVSRHLASALSQAGRPTEAVAELEQALLPQTWEMDASGERFPSEGGLEAAARGRQGDKEAATLWDSLARAKYAVGDVLGAVDAGKTPYSTRQHFCLFIRNWWLRKNGSKFLEET